MERRSQRPAAVKSRFRSMLREFKEILNPEEIKEVMDEELVGTQEDIEDSGVQAEQDVDPDGSISTPSVLCKRKHWKPYQFNSRKRPRFVCYRGPPEAQPPIPVILLHKDFSDFCLALENPTTEQLENGDYDLAEWVFDKFTEGFDNEPKDMTQPLARMLGKYIRPVIYSMDADGNKIFTDGMILSGEMNCIVLFEDKKEGDAYFQALEYCRSLFLSDIGKSSHCLVVLRQCPGIQFISVVMDWRDRRILAEPLTDLLNFWGPTQKGLVVTQRAKAFKALKNFCGKYRGEPSIDVTHPWCVREWTDLRMLDKSGLVWVGKKEDVHAVGKFTCLYSEDAHRAWASAGFAPQFEVEHLGNGWMFIEMEYLSGANGWVSASSYIKTHKQDSVLKAALHNFLNEAHKTGYIHGDFRPPNVFVRTAQSGGFECRAIDFDWSGCDGNSFYPVRPSPEITWPPGVAIGQTILKTHDHWFVDHFDDSI